jgi:hypothetical protein
MNITTENELQDNQHKAWLELQAALKNQPNAECLKGLTLKDMMEQAKKQVKS